MGSSGSSVFSTGVEVVDSFFRLVFAVLLGILFLIMAGRMVRMLQRHEYAQLIAALGIFLLAFWVIAAPNSFFNVFKSLVTSLSREVGGGGGGGGTP